MINKLFTRKKNKKNTTKKIMRKRKQKGGNNRGGNDKRGNDKRGNNKKNKTQTGTEKTQTNNKTLKKMSCSPSNLSYRGYAWRSRLPRRSRVRPAVRRTQV